MNPRISILIPTKNRATVLAELLASLANLNGLAELRPEIVIADNDSQDDTQRVVRSAIDDLPAEVKMTTTLRAGKSAALNDALKVATGDYLAFIDDDVIVARDWLRAIDKYFRENRYLAGQGRIGLRAPDCDDPTIVELIERFRTIPQLAFGADIDEVTSLNGANIFIARQLIDQVGGFDERLGPGASGTSEDVDLARRLRQAGRRIGYAPDSVVYHRIERHRLTEAYFENIHRCQGRSRLLIKPRGYTEILLNAARAYCQYFIYSLAGKERSRYRSKGRIFHYLGMLEGKRRESARDRN